MKKILGAIQDLPANQHSQSGHNLSNWAGLAVLVSCQMLNGSQDFFHTFSMALYHKWDVKNDFPYVLQFFSLISDGLGSVSGMCVQKTCLNVRAMCGNFFWVQDCLFAYFCTLLKTFAYFCKLFVTILRLFNVVSLFIYYIFDLILQKKSQMM